MLGFGFARLIVTSLGTAHGASPAAARRYIDDEECNFSTDVNRHTLLFMVWRSPTPTLSARLQVLLPSHIIHSMRFQVRLHYHNTLFTLDDLPYSYNGDAGNLQSVILAARVRFDNLRAAVSFYCDGL